MNKRPICVLYMEISYESVKENSKFSYLLYDVLTIIRLEIYHMRQLTSTTFIVNNTQ